MESRRALWPIRGDRAFLASVTIHLRINLCGLQRFPTISATGRIQCRERRVEVCNLSIWCVILALDERRGELFQPFATLPTPGRDVVGFSETHTKKDVRGVAQGDTATLLVYAGSMQSLCKAYTKHVAIQVFGGAILAEARDVQNVIPVL